MPDFDPYYQWLGIPPKDQPPDAYRLLAIERFEASPGVIEAALEQRMLLLRARQGGAHAAETQHLLNEITQAGRLLLDPGLKPMYDQTLRARFQPGPAAVETVPAEVSVKKAPLKIEPTPRGAPRPPRRAKSPSSALLLWGIGSGAVLLMLSVIAVVIALSGQRGEQSAVQAKPTRKPQPRRTAPQELDRATQVFRPAAIEQPLPLIEEQPRQPTEPLVIDSVPMIDAVPIVEVELPPPMLTAVALEPVVAEEETSPPPQEPVAAEKKQLLALSDLKFVGAFKLPQKACGASTGFATGCLALRRNGSKLTLLSDSHLGTGGAVYEFEPASLATGQPYSAATVKRELRDIYQGHKRKADRTSYELDGLVPTTGLRWDDASSSLWWAYGEKYNTENQTAPSFGATKIEGETLTARGPWKVTLPQSWQRGGTLEIPAWFAERHCGGKRLGVGFGGYYSIFKGGSYGPALAAVGKLNDAGESPCTVLLGYPEPHFCPREGNYRHASAGWMGRDPQGGRGTWNATDEIGGEIHSAGAIWLDAPEKHGVLFFCSLGTGRIAYEDGGVQCEGRENSLFVYDPLDLAKVAAGKLKSWQPVPKQYKLENPAPGLSGRAAGVAYDSTTRRLYVVFTEAYLDGEEAYPVVVVYQI